MSKEADIDIAVTYALMRLGILSSEQCKAHARVAIETIRERDKLYDFNFAAGNH